MNNTVTLRISRTSGLRSLSKEDLEALTPTLAEHLQELLETDGPRAFEAPRSAAIAHEVGHAIVGTHDRIKITSIAVWPATVAVWPATNAGGWTGVTRERANRWQVRPDAPISEVLSRACFIIAGETGEAVLDPDGYRHATSLDEIVLSQRLILGHASRLGVEPEPLWQTVRNRAAAILRHNKKLADELIARLDRTQSLQRRPLQEVLEQVRQLPQDWHPLPCLP